MRTVLLALAALAATSVLTTGAARADQPFCLKTGAGPGDCKYDSYAECQAAASGIYGICQPNTWLQATSQPQSASAPHHRRSSRAHRAAPQG